MNVEIPEALFKVKGAETISAPFIVNELNLSVGN